jgi:phage terminase large subunit-like protein
MKTKLPKTPGASSARAARAKTSSSAAWRVSQDPGKTRELLAGITEEGAGHVLDAWSFWARGEQRAPDIARAGDWTTWVFLGGRGCGKTRAGAEWVRALIARAPGPLRIALIGETYADARHTMVEGVSGLMTICPTAERPEYFPSLRELRWANGSRAQLFSSEDPEGLRGPQFHYAWADELAKWQNGEATWAMLQLALRLGLRPRQLVTTTPRPVRHLQAIFADPGTRVTHATSYANRANLSDAFFSHVVTRYEGTDLGRQELLGELVEAREGALFRRADIARARVAQAPELSRIVVAVDPPVTAGEAADECGLIVAGRAGADAYVLADLSLQGVTPSAWAERVAAAAEEFAADRVVIEVNQGGDLIETLLRQFAPELPVRPVRATRGKSLRAEPVAALYERGRVHHVGLFPALEDQMAHFDEGGRVRGASPDRVDALVWAITDLVLAREAEPRLRKL